MQQLSLIIQTPDHVAFEGAVDSVSLVTELGEMEIFSNHADLVGTILFSRVVVHIGKHEEDFFARLGMVFVDNTENTVRILAQYCVKVKEFDHLSIKEYRQFVQDKLQSREGLNGLQITHLEESELSLKAMSEALDVVNK